MTTTHELKTLPAYFDAVWAGGKTFEVRYDDRGYQRGDQVTLREWDRTKSCDCTGSHHTTACARYTGREVTATIGHVMAFTPNRGSIRGFNGNGYVVFSLCNPQASLRPDVVDKVKAIARIAAMAGVKA